MEEEITGETSDGVGQQYTAEQPPLVVEGRRKKKLKVMVALDESDVSLYALKWTLQNLFKNPTGEHVRAVEPDPEQGMVTVVHVVQPFELYTFPAEPSMYASAAMVESVRKAQQQNAEQLLSRAFQLCKETKVKSETLILEGNPKEMLCQAVEEMHFDLLVVGSRGLGAIKRALLGSISDFCAHHSRCPILIVKPPHK
ncbi:putative universal stress protein A [Helianthus annuus]|uniref:Putative adenine nucleotide alpha hydrolases-like superfamily protein n=1 Tax=Helianthus annuus TaxID=4232 RepID=A0A251VRE8_HELAN|nr:putative universal stress protein A [Helianthus annuus]